MNRVNKIFFDRYKNPCTCTYFISRSGKKYKTTECSICKKNKRFVEKLKDAEKETFTPIEPNNLWKSLGL